MLFRSGIQPEFDKLVFDPRLPKEWSEVSVKRTFQGKEFDIKIIKSNFDEGIQIKLNGNFIKGNAIKLTDAQQKNKVVISIKN